MSTYRIDHKNETGELIREVTYSTLGELIDDYYDGVGEITPNDIVTVVSDGLETKEALHTLITDHVWSVIGIDYPHAECA